MGGKMQFYPVLALVMFGWPIHVFAGLQDARRVPNPSEPAEPPHREVALEHNVPVPNPPELAEPPHREVALEHNVPVPNPPELAEPPHREVALEPNVPVPNPPEPAEPPHREVALEHNVPVPNSPELAEPPHMSPIDSILPSTDPWSLWLSLFALCVAGVVCLGGASRLLSRNRKRAQASSQTSRNEQVVVPSMAPERPNDMPPDAARAHDVETLLNSMQARRALALSQGEKFVSAPAERQTSRPTLEAALVARIAAIGKRETEARKARENRTEPSQVTTD